MPSNAAKSRARFWPAANTLSNIQFSHFSILPNPGAQAPFAKILPNINVELFECPHSKRDYRANVQRKK